MLPSVSTSTPGNFLSRSSTFASFFVLKDFTLNSIVSFLIVIGALDFIIIASKLFADFNDKVPKF